MSVIGMILTCWGIGILTSFFCLAATLFLLSIMSEHEDNIVIMAAAGVTIVTIILPLFLGGWFADRIFFESS